MIAPGDGRDARGAGDPRRAPRPTASRLLARAAAGAARRSLDRAAAADGEPHGLGAAGLGRARRALARASPRQGARAGAARLRVALWSWSPRAWSADRAAGGRAGCARASGWSKCSSSRRGRSRRCGRDRLPAALRARQRADRARRRGRRPLPAGDEPPTRSCRRARSGRSLHRLRAPRAHVGADFSLWRVHRAYPAERYASAPRVCSTSATTTRRLARIPEGHEQRLARARLPRARGLPRGLSRPSTPSGSVPVSSGVDRARRRVEELAGVGRCRADPGAELQELAASEQRDFRARQRASIGARRATTGELQWLLRRAACRGVAEPELDGHWEPDALVLSGAGDASVRAARRDLWALRKRADDRAGADPRSSTASRDAPTRRSSALGSLAEEAEFPGAAELLFAPLEGAGFPVDAVLHARWSATARRSRRCASGSSTSSTPTASSSQGAAHGPSLLAEEDRELAREYEAQLQAGGHPPMLCASICLALGAAEEEELERRVAVLRERYGEFSSAPAGGLQHPLSLTTSRDRTVV